MKIFKILKLIDRYMFMVPVFFSGCAIIAGLAVAHGKAHPAALIVSSLFAGVTMLCFAGGNKNG